MCDYSVFNGQGINDFNLMLKKHPNQSIIVMFSNSNCHACKAALPIFKELPKYCTSNKAVFAVVDTQTSPELFKKYSITMTPSFLIFNNGVMVDKYVGLSSEVLDKIANNHAGINISKSKLEEIQRKTLQ